MLGDPRSSPWLFPSAPDEATLWLVWLVRLRWVALFAQVVTFGFVWRMLPGAPSVVLWAVTVAAVAIANAIAIGQLNQQQEASDWTVFGHLLFDVVALTLFFMISGGPANPFTLLYLVHIAMGAVMLPPRFTSMLGSFVLLCYTLLFPFHLDLAYDRHSLPAGALMGFGQWLAFGITSLCVSIFVVGIARTLRRRKEQLLEARDRTARTDRLRSLGTLAAGAAHELNTPLSTVGLRVRRIGRRHKDSDTERDLEVIQGQLERCTGIVRRLLVGAGDPAAADIERRPLVAMVEESVKLWRAGSRLSVELQDTSEGVVVELPQIAFQQALINLLENAREAQEEAGVNDALELRIKRDGSSAEPGAPDGQIGIVEIADRGCGLPPAADQVGEPFFTTKSTGTGLGVFVARQIADGAGGGLSYHPRRTSGTVARWWFPEASRRSP